MASVWRNLLQMPRARFFFGPRLKSRLTQSLADANSLHLERPTLPTTCLLYLPTVPAYCTCLLCHLSPVPAFGPTYHICAVYPPAAPCPLHLPRTCLTYLLHCACRLHLPTVPAYCTCLLYLRAIPAYCCHLLAMLSVGSPESTQPHAVRQVAMFGRRRGRRPLRGNFQLLGGND